MEKLVSSFIPLCFSLVLFFVNAEAQQCKTQNIAGVTAEQSQWFFTQNTKPRGVFLAVHGLNFRPSRLRSVVQLLLDEGFDVYRLTLPGHSETGPEEALRITASELREVTLKAYFEVKKRADCLQVPTYHFGYSLGALLGAVLLSADHQVVQYKKMIFFAPGIGLRWYDNLLKITIPFFDYIPSVSFYEYRAHAKTPTAYMKSGYELNDFIWEKGRVEELGVPTAIFMSERDEVVSPSKTEQFIREKKLNNWKIYFLNRRGAMKSKYAHLFIDEQTIQSDDWENLKSLVHQFLVD